MTEFSRIRFWRVGGIALMAVMLSGGMARADLTVMDNRQNVEHACTGGDTVAVLGSDNNIRITGKCGTVSVQGNKNQIQVEAAATIAATGNKNTVLWQRGPDDRNPPRVSNLGSGNVVKRVGGAPPAEPPRAPPPGEPGKPPAAAPAKPAGNLRARGPIKCRKFESVKVENALIETDGVAVEAHGSCQIVIVGSRIVGGVGINSHGAASVEVRNSQIEGKLTAIDVHGKSTLTAAGSTFVGRKNVHGAGKLVDDGSNTWR